MIVHAVVRAEHLTTSSTGGVKVGHQVLTNSVRPLFIHGRNRVELMRQLHVEDDVGEIHQHILICLIVRGEKVAISKDERIQLSSVAHMVTEIVCSKSLLVDVL